MRGLGRNRPATTISNEADPMIPPTSAENAVSAVNVQPSIGTGRSLLRRALLGIALLAVMVTSGAMLMHAGVDVDRTLPGGPDQAERRTTLAEVRTWGIQLRNLDPQAAAASPFDLLVIDPDDLKGWRKNTQTTGVDIVRRRPDGSRRQVLAYVSIGKVESGRAHWNPEWSQSGSGPAWLLKASTQEGAPHPVRYWNAEWQSKVFGSAQATVDQIIAAGFDGVLLDHADTHALFRNERSNAETDMVDFIVRLAAYAREQNPTFLVLMQNAEELVAHARLPDAIDAVVKNDLLFGVAGHARPNSEADISASLHYLQKFRRTGQPVFVLEYIAEGPQAAAAIARIEQLSFLPYLAPRDLGRLVATR
jgi:cysteinyl-tRNA synthetase, unknown class